MKILKNKSTKDKGSRDKGLKNSEEIRLPELKVHGIWNKIINLVSHIRHIYWIISFTVLLVIFLILVPNYLWVIVGTVLQTQGILVIMVLIFSFVAVSLVWTVGQRIDVWVFMRFNMPERRAPWLDWIMLGLTQIGNFIFALVVAMILFLIGNYLLAYELVLGILTLGLLVQIMKILIRRVRPYNKLENIRIVGSRASGHSFPSGHTGQSFLMATLMAHYYNVDIYLWFVLYGIALLVGITRIYVGMHYPRDVIGGAILGTVWGFLGIIVNHYIG